MTTRQLEAGIFITIAVFLGGFFAWQNYNSTPIKFQKATVVSEGEIQKIIIPTVYPHRQIETSSQISPDGTKKLSMEKIRNAEENFTYVFTVADGSGSDKRQLYKTKGSESFSISFNTWSPDNKYLFITKNGNDALVFKETGEPFAGGEPYLAIQTPFAEKIKNETVSEITGWASPTLLIVNTLNEDKTKGPSFWFEVPSKVIIQLASEF